MVDETKNPTVELDTDDVKETNVEVKETTNDSVKKADLNVGEVDLGYTSHTNKKEEKAQIVVEEEAKQEQPKVETKQENVDDLSNLSEGVQKRIDKLTRKYREAERREQAALDYAKALQKKYSDFEQKYDSGEEMYLKEYEARIDAQREQVKVKLAEAYQSQDVTKITEAQDELTKLTVEKEKARIRVSQNCLEQEFILNPASKSFSELALTAAKLKDLEGGDTKENAQILLKIFSGEAQEPSLKIKAETLIINTALMLLLKEDFSLFRDERSLVKELTRNYVKLKKILETQNLYEFLRELRKYFTK